MSQEFAEKYKSKSRFEQIIWYLLSKILFLIVILFLRIYKHGNQKGHPAVPLL